MALRKFNPRASDVVSGSDAGVVLVTGLPVPSLSPAIRVHQATQEGVPSVELSDIAFSVADVRWYVQQRSETAQPIPSLVAALRRTR